MKKSGIFGVTALVLVVVAGSAGYIWFENRNKATLIDVKWAAHSPDSTTEVNHDPWQALLDDYLVTDEEDPDIHLFDYSGLVDDGREPLDEYIAMLEAVDPSQLNINEQKAYWFNVYNAVTVSLIVNNFPVESITQLGSGGVSSFGPWDDKLFNIDGDTLSLNEIEHGIIRPLYDDFRIHFAVNCASIGCPDLAVEAFRGDNLEEQLNAATESYLQHPRGLRFEGDQLHLSTLFEWYGSDFGADFKSMLNTFGKYTTEDVSAQLADYNGEPEYFYDWSLNGYCAVDNSCGG